ncbi:hypothetical protein NDU88_002436 [Pleurodeles waltl]|uniref:Uncharacterized protein n=1 Tax=Pleurodeles waltl TaxID=8319 RepID=A0AAV7TML0_PLEWA|nr:hypothetical protein NDU88_002436 [Pleurodeles waltl]
MKSRGITSETPKTPARAARNMSREDHGTRKMETSKKQVAKETMTEVEHRVRAPSPPTAIREQLDEDTLEMDDELTNALPG